MRSHAKASSAGSIAGSGNGRGLLRRAFATRGFAGDANGSGAPATRPASIAASLIAVLAAMLIAASAAIAAPPAVTIQPASEIGVSSARANGTVDPQGKETNYRFEYTTDTQYVAEGNSFANAAQVGFGTTSSAGPVPPVTLEGLVPNTKYHLRLVAENEDSAGTPSVAVAADFTTDVAAVPTVTINPATEIKFSGAHLSGTVDPEGGNANPIEGTLPIRWEFQYSPDPLIYGWWGFGGEGTFSGAEAEGNSPLAVSADLTGAPFLNTKYKFRLVAFYAGGQAANSPEGEFDLAKVTPPGVAVDPVSANTGTTAHFSGSVTPGNADPAFNSECVFHFLTDAEFQPRDEQQRLVVTATGGTYTLTFFVPGGGEQTTAPIAFDASAAQVQAALEGLAAIGPGDVILSGGPGDEKGSLPYTLKFAGALAATNLAPLGSDGSALTGSPIGLTVSTLKEGHLGFEGARQIGCTPGYITGPGSTPVSADPRSLLPGTLYHLRLRAVNAGGAGVADTTFTTPVIAPRVRTGSARPSASGAELAGEVNPNGGATTYYFEYGPGFGQKTTEKTLPAGTQGVSVSATLSGLAPSTQYPYRLVASNSAAKATGTDKVFTTTSGVVDSCPNAEFRFGAQASLPDCRAYEMVSPPGLDYIDIVRMPGASDDGSFTGIATMNASDDARGGATISTMLSRRTPNGWVTVDANPQTTRSYANTLATTHLVQFSTDGQRALLRSNAPIHPDQL